MTTIEEARDLNKLGLEDLISSLKCHEIGLSEDEPGKKSKSIALKSKGKSSKAFKVDESKDKSPAEGFEEMAMLRQNPKLILKIINFND